MTFEEFNTFQTNLVAECIKMRDTKGKEYAHDADRFANFRREAAKKKTKGLDALDIASIYLAKHLYAIEQFVDTRRVYSEPIRGRIVDTIVYLTLMAGIIEEMENEIGV